MKVLGQFSVPLSSKAQVAVVAWFIRPLLNCIRSWTARVREMSAGTLRFFNAANTSQPLIIFILGPPGAGKGTQSALLKASFPGLTHLSYGDLLRYLDQIPGSWVSSFPRRNGGTKPMIHADAAVQMLRETIDAGVKRGQLTWLIDGFPRSEAHVKAWISHMPAARFTLYLDCPREILIQRVLGRAESSGRSDDAVLSLVQERVGRGINESDALLCALAKYGMSATKVDASLDVDEVKRKVHAIFQEISNASELEQRL
ncbi:P-loop containing nucleoside triphosphate hydrolase protein [Whalleya microplaca]|nr:P-loop containing nucleoside triphosphate hydrolase protein [Whalleya microplaca]